VVVKLPVKSGETLIVAGREKRDGSGVVEDEPILGGQPRANGWKSKDMYRRSGGKNGHGAIEGLLREFTDLVICEHRSSPLFVPPSE